MSNARISTATIARMMVCFIVEIFKWVFGYCIIGNRFVPLWPDLPLFDRFLCFQYILNG